MQRLRMAHLALWFGAVTTVGSLGVLARSSQAGLMDRPADVLCPPEAYLCPFGLSHRLAPTHHDEPAARVACRVHEPLSAPPASVAVKPLETPPLDVMPAPFDVPCLPFHGPYARMASCSCEEEHRSLADIVADRRHSAGLEDVLRINAENEGLVAVAKAKMVAGDEQPSRIWSWSLGVWNAMRQGMAGVAQGISTLAGAATGAPEMPAEMPEVEVELPEAEVELIDPQPIVPLHDTMYYLPEFGSPWDGDL